MRLYFLGAVLCVVALSRCRASPITTITAHQDGHASEEQTQAEIQKNGEMQEETQGVFKSDETSAQKAVETVTESNSVEQRKEEAKDVNPEKPEDAKSVAPEKSDKAEEAKAATPKEEKSLGQQSEKEVAETEKRKAAPEVPAVEPAAAASELSPSDELDAQEAAAGEDEQGADVEGTEAAAADLIEKDPIDGSEAVENAVEPTASPKMPAIYISKYNRFVDNILGRINRILGKSYDPVRVKLQSVDNKNKNNGNGNGKGKGKKKNKVNRKSQRTKDRMTNKMGQLQIARASVQFEVDGGERSLESESREPSFILISKAGTASEQDGTNSTSTATETRARPVKQNNANKKNKKKNSTKAGATTNKNNKVKQGNGNKNKPKMRATLFGLSSIKRDGDVTGGEGVRVGARRELKSATATTTEMYGRLNLRIIHGGAATLHSIRVLQPKQVRVDSQDNHDKTREFMWKRSAHIASVVARKLSSAAKSMLKPPPSYAS
ncbi:hypothetical protein NQ318_016679 [Aromia moschata]|uniref:Uncharacterized protein n=1 Tax=Aromia moschata TaxID=1265417 RepID=A0AAV8Y1A9_9CUCU|nr:hypothetical protein NQ318_016679 [Aromia moschata]